MTIHDHELWLFIRESNKIEDIHREPTETEFIAHKTLLGLKKVRVQDVERFVFLVADAEIRSKLGMNVTVGNHIPPVGGPHIVDGLEKILQAVNHKHSNPYTTHVKYETLHPFLDGNGRSGRALWLKMMVRNGYDGSLGFLHMWYYQSLDGARKRDK